MNLQAIVNGYVECALWADGNAGSEFLKDELREVRRDVKAFVKEAQALLVGMDEAQIGHDFYLTRNHHGAGFWDRGLGQRGELLTKLAHTFGETHYDF
jgi:hypothetical protein